MKSSIKRLEKLRKTLHRQAELAFEKARADLAGTRAAQQSLYPNQAGQDYQAADLQHLERLAAQLEVLAIELTRTQDQAQAQLATAATEHKQIEKIVESRRNEETMQLRRNDQTVVETWIRNLRNPRNRP